MSRATRIRYCKQCSVEVSKGKQLCEPCNVKNKKERDRLAIKSKPNIFCSCGAQLSKKSSKSCFSCNMKNRWSNQEYKEKVTESINSSIRKYDIDFVRTFIENKGGKLISNQYNDTRSSINIECSIGHKWDSKFDFLINRNHWCPYCAGAKVLNPIQWMSEKAQLRGGKLLSNKYLKSTSKYEFICSNNHNFTMSYSLLKHQNCWCPTCQSGLTERKCRLWMEAIFNSKFPPTRNLLFLKIDNKTRLQLDGYSNELSLAFEYQGEQHYKDLLRKDGRILFTQSKYDSLKENLCKENGIKLITIPFTNKNEIKECIRHNCFVQNINLPNNFDKIFVDENQAYINDKDNVQLNNLKQILSKRDFILNNISWLGSLENYSYSCLICGKNFSKHYSTLMSDKHKICCSKRK